MKLLSKLTIIFSLLFSVQLYASEIKVAKCPDGYLEKETQFFQKIADETSENDIVQSVDLHCGIIIPNIAIDEFKNLPQILALQKQYPGDIIQWSVRKGTTVLIGLYSRINEDQTIEFLKVMYGLNTGNLVLTRVVFSVQLPSSRNNAT